MAEENKKPEVQEEVELKTNVAAAEELATPDSIEEPKGYASPAQANPEKFLKEFNWHNYEEGIDPIDDDKLDEFEKLVAENFVDTLDDEVVEGTVINITDRDAIIDINAKSEGVISLNEFRYNPNLAVGDKTYRVLAREVQLDPVTEALLHIDFLRLAADSTVNVDVPVVFLNEEESPGIKRGGVLNVVRRTVELVCRADAIPTSVEADIGELDIGDSVKINAVSLPEGVRPVIADRDFTIVTVAAPTVMVEEEVEEDEVELGEDGEPIEGETPPTEGPEGADSDAKPEAEEGDKS